MRTALTALTALSALSGCSSCAKDDPAPTKSDTSALALVPAITLERPGKAPIAIDRALLTSTSPSSTDGPFTAWRLVALVPDYDERAPVDVIDEEGYRSPLLRAGEDPGALETLLIVGKDGESRILRAAPNKAITAHRGETRKDAGRVRHVAKLVVLAKDANGDAGVVAGPAVSLKVLVAGKETTWTRAELAKVKPIVLMSKDGDGERDAWSLRALATELVGPNAMPSEVLGEEPKSVRIEAKQWKDEALVPVIRANRRGRLKLVWLDAKTHEEDHDEPQLKGVSEVRFP